MSGTLRYDNTEVFVTPGTATPFLELTSAPGVTGFRLYTQGTQLLVRDTLNNITVFATQGVTGATGPRGLQGNPGLGVQGPMGIEGPTGNTGPQGQNGVSGGLVLFLDSAGGSAPQTSDLIDIPAALQTTITVPGNWTIANFVAQFTTLPDTTVSMLILGGVWSLNLFANVTSGTAQIYFNVYSVDSTGGSETLISGGSFTNATVITSFQQQYTYSVYFPQTTLPDRSYRIRIRVFTQFSDTSPSNTLTLYFGDGNASFLNTTIEKNAVPFNFTGEGQLIYISSSTLVGVPEMTYTRNRSTVNFRNLLTYNSTIGNAAFFSSLTASTIAVTYLITAPNMSVDTFTGNLLTTSSVVANNISSLNAQIGELAGSSMTMSTVISKFITTEILETDIFSGNQLTTSSITADNISTLFAQIDELTVGSLASNYISTGILETDVFSAYQLTTSSITANNISSLFAQIGGLTVSSLVSKNISTGILQTNVFSGNQLTTSSITADNISTLFAQIDELTVGSLASNYISTGILETHIFSGNQITTSSITANNVSTLFAQIGELTISSLVSNYISTGILETDVFYGNQITTSSISVNYVSTGLFNSDVIVGNKLIISSITTNNISTLLGQINRVEASSITTSSLVAANLSTYQITTSSFVSDNLSSLFGQIGFLTASRIVTSSLVAANISTSLFMTSSIVSNNISSLFGQIRVLTTSSITASSIVANNILATSEQVTNLVVYNSTIGNVAWFSTTTASTMRVGTLANNNFVFFSKNNTPYYSNSVSSFSLVGENLSNVFYVAKNGDDTLGDGSQMRPFLTISTAVGQAPANAYCAVYVSPGIYEEYVVVTNPSLSMYGTTRGSKFNQGAIIKGSLTIMNNSASPSAVANAVCEYAGLHITQRSNNTSTSLITIRDYDVSIRVFQVNFASMLLTAENINAHCLLISSFSQGSNGNLTRVNIQNSRFALTSVSSAIGLKGGMLWEMNDNYVQNTGSGSALEIVGGTGQILDIRNNTLSADTGSALTIDKLFSSFNYGFRRNIITANTDGATVTMTSNNGYTYFVKFPVPFTDNYIANTKADTGGNSLFEMTGSDNFINLTQNELLLSMPKDLFPFNPAYVVRGNTSNTIFHRNNTLAAPNPDTLLSTVGTYSPGMSTVQIPVFLDYIDPQLFISSLTTNNISSLRGQVGAFTASSIVANNISSLRGQVGAFTTSSIVANNISSLSGQVGAFTTSSIVANNISSLRGQVGAFTTSSIVANNISSLSGQVGAFTTSSIVANNISSLFGQIGQMTISSMVAQNISSLAGQIRNLTTSSINGVAPISTGFAFGDYLYWNGSVWNVGDTNISLGGNAGQTSQGSAAVAVGQFAGQSSQGSSAVAVGQYAGNSGQATGAVAVGQGAALNNQTANAIAIGNGAGTSNQGGTAIAIGNSAGRLLQSTSAIAIGASCGYNSQGVNAIAIGIGSASTLQGTNAVSIGPFTGKNAQGANAIAIGIEAGGNVQGTNTVAIGAFAGSTILGTNSIAIGAFASQSGLSTNTIVFNATGVALNPQVSSALYIAPIRNNVNANSLPLVYDTVAKEITYTSVLTFSSLTVSSIVSNNISTLTERVGTLTATTINVSTINISSLSQTAPIGNTLTVDSIYGNDTTAALDRYAKPFSTITAALALATSGQNVIVRPGTYNETLVMPDGVSVTGAGTQCVIIQKLNVTSNTILITMSTNNRFENFTANLTTATNGVDLIGCFLPSRATTTSKIRQSVWNISSATTTPCSTIAMYSPGVTANPSTFSSPNIIQRTTLNVAAGAPTGGLTRGIYVNGPNRFAVRDMVVNARGISSIGIETADANAFADVKTTSVYGEAIDVLRGQGNLELGFTNLQNGTCGTSSFSVVLEPSFTTFGIVGNLKTDHLYYITPGVVSEATADTILAATLVEIPVTQNLILIAGTMIFSGTLPSGASLTFNLYKRIGGVTPPDILVYTLQLTASQKKVVNQRLSVEFDNRDTYYATLTTVGNPGTGTFTTTLSFY